jgi:ABC-type Fe3+/spermidine/putrescine transport system ATPase subunit
VLCIQGVTKSFSGQTILQNTELMVKRGEFFSLLGPSGCGKTTLLRLLAGFEQPDTGTISLGDLRLDLLPPHRRPVNLVFQKYALFPHLNVRQNVSFGLEMKKVPRAELHTRVDEALALVRMENFAERSISTLSGGQQQRVALARAIVNRPDVLLLDEPLSALDLKLRQQMHVELIELQKRLGSTFIFVTHDQEEALTLSDRIAVMNHGIIEQVGTPREIYEHPSSAFVARFIGSVNELDAGFSERGRRRKLFIRPEKMLISPTDPGAGELRSVKCRIREVLYLGPVTRIWVDVAESARPWSILESRSQPTTLKMGDSAYVSWRTSDQLILEVDANDSGVVEEPEVVLDEQPEVIWTSS